MFDAIFMAVGRAAKGICKDDAITLIIKKANYARIFQTVVVFAH